MTIELAASGIQPQHAEISTVMGEGTYLRPLNDKACGFISVNGRRLDSMDSVELHHNDRIIFGMAMAYVFRWKD